MDLRATLNLPDPDFTIPMKAGLPKREPEAQRKWEHMNLYEIIQKARRGRPKFILHDGPPYTNSPIHVGTMLNKSLKDFVVRYKTLRGFHAPYVPGYDTHGLPIELAVMKKLGKSLSPSEMRNACRNHAEEYADIQTRQFKRLSILGLWDKPYKTMAFGFEAAIVRAFAELAKKGFIYRDLKPTHWSTYSRTALAETELVYEDKTSLAIFVRFPLKSDPNNIFRNFNNKSIYTIIWTTTSWTIPANLACAFHPELDYVLLEVNNEAYIILKDLIESVAQQLDWTDYNVLQTLKGKQLEGVVFKHPIFERDSIAVLADYVSTEEGTGVVHTAPGHGAEDFYTGRKYGLEILCPVDEGGVFTQEAGEFAGQKIEQADETVVNRLKEVGHLLKAYNYQHSYPFSERDKHPVIFRSTDQWFIKIDHDNLRQKALAEIKNVKWFPPQGQARITAMVEGRPDWCISRQRVWGVGIPVIYGAQSNKPVFDADIMERVAQLVEQKGSSAWFDCDINEIIPKGFKHPETGETEFKKETDILDVWFDSGVTHLAVLDMKYEHGWDDLEWPCDLYLEGSDQHRGWFNSSLMTAVAIKGSAPYRQVLTHGWVVDEHGRRMSKSLGNVVDPAESAEKHGADVLRLWAASVDYEADMPCGENLLKQIAETYRRIRNTLRFLLGNLYDYDPNAGYTITTEFDKWIVEQTQKLESECCESYEKYAFREVTSRIHNFCVQQLSSFYLDAIKDCMYCDAPNSPRRRSAQTACHKILMILTKLMAPILPFTTEEVYERIPLQKKQPTVFLEEIQPLSEQEINQIENRELTKRYNALLKFKDKLYVQLESWRTQTGVKDSQDVLVRVFAPNETIELLKSFGEDLPNYLKISWMEFETAQEEKFLFEQSPFLKCERSRIRRPDVEMINGIPLSKRDREVLNL